MAGLPTRDPPIIFLRGRDWKDGDGWTACLIVAPAMRLMDRPADFGRRGLAGVGLAVNIRWPWGRRPWNAWISAGDTRGWRSPVRIQAWTDAGEIGRRIAARAGWPA